MNLNEKKGITIITLVIIITVILIFIMTAYGLLVDNGVIEKAVWARERNRLGEIKEKIQSEVLSSYNHNGSINMEELKDNLEKNMGIDKSTIKDTLEYGVTFPYDDLQVDVNTNADVEFEYKKNIVKPPEIEQKDISFNIKPNNWTNQDVKVEITTQVEGFELQYKIGEESDPESDSGWEFYREPVDIAENTLIYARLVNKAVEAKNYATGEVGNIDKTKPNISDFTMKVKTITAVVSDEQSGIKEYMFSQDDSLTENSSGWQSISGTPKSTSQSHTCTTLGKWYFYVKDVAGNMSKSEIEVTNTSPVMATSNVYTQSNDVYSLNIYAMATDSDGDQIQYKLYKQDGTYVTSTTGSPGSGVTLQLSGLSMYTNYSYYVEATDQFEVVRQSNSGKTKCSGTTNYCSSGYRNYRYWYRCSYCNAEYTVRHYHCSTHTGITLSSYQRCGQTLYKNCNLKRTTYQSYSGTRKCSYCGKSFSTTYRVKCSSNHTAVGNYYCSTHRGSAYNSYYNTTCTTQVTNGTCSNYASDRTNNTRSEITSQNMCPHGYYNTHYYCIHNNGGSAHN